jgi:hypothetical protein
MAFSFVLEPSEPSDSAGRGVGLPVQGTSSPTTTVLVPCTGSHERRFPCPFRDLSISYPARLRPDLPLFSPTVIESTRASEAESIARAWAATGRVGREIDPELPLRPPLSLSLVKALTFLG